MTITITSAAFAANDQIPREFTCDGTNISPPIAWSNVPANTKSIAILVEDPDAPKAPYTHWVVTGIPPSVTSLPAGAQLPEGAAAGKNDAERLGYTGPCPPDGRHHYHFHVYALDTLLSAPLTRRELRAAIRGHVLDEGELVAVYQKAVGR
jgi:Raf kinase inhibitor-like YbhB/YbcL family protein